MTFTEADVQRHMTRAKAGWRKSLDLEPGETESPLQSEIVAWGHTNGYPCHAHPRTNHYIIAHQKGADWPDIEVRLPGGRCVVFELKAKGKKQTPGQIMMMNTFRYLGHEYYPIWTWREFIDIINLKPEEGHES